MVKSIFPLIIVVFFAFVAGFPLLHKGLPPTHDGEYHVVRFYEFYQTLQDGNWYPRWAADLNNGYGVPLFNYVYPLPNYVASFFHFLGISFIDSFKLNMFFASILGAVFFYLWSRQFWGGLGGVVSSIFYTFSPYHFVDIYIRGSVGEVWALAFFPAFLWSITKFVRYKQRIFFLLSPVFLSLIIFSHNILALMFSFFAISYTIFLICQSKFKKYFILNTFYIILLGIGLSAIFWIPALFEKQYVVGLEVFGFENHFPDLYQLIIPSWGSGFSGEGLGSSPSFQIGIANLFVVLICLLSVIFIFVFRHSGNPAQRGQSRISNGSERFWTSQNDNNVNILLFFLVWFFVIFFLMLKVSLPIWQIVPFMNYFQFPWRLLSLGILIASFLAGSVVQFFSLLKFKTLKLFIGLCLMLLSFSLGMGYAKPAHYLYRDDNYYLERPNFIDGTNSPGNLFNTIWINRNLKKEKEKIKIVKGEDEITKLATTSTHYKFNIFAHQPSEIVVYTAYFPGWTVFIDGKDEKVRYNKDGLINFLIPQGKHSVDVMLLDTHTRKLASFVTVVSLLYSVVVLTRSLRGVLWRK